MCLRGIQFTGSGLWPHFTASLRWLVIWGWSGVLALYGCVTNYPEALVKAQAWMFSCRFSRGRPQALGRSCVMAQASQEGLLPSFGCSLAVAGGLSSLPHGPLHRRLMAAGCPRAEVWERQKDPPEAALCFPALTGNDNQHFCWTVGHTGQGWCSVCEEMAQRCCSPEAGVTGGAERVTLPWFLRL